MSYKVNFRIFLMKKAKVCLIAALVLGASYSGLWMVQASRFEKRLLQHISQVIEETPFDMHFTCDSISKGGFPFDIQISLQNPKLEIARTVLDTIASTNQHVLDCALDGTVVDTFSILGRLKKVEAAGHALFTLSKSDIMPAAQWNAKGAIEVELSQPYSVQESFSSLFSDKIQEIQACTITCGEGKLINLAQDADVESVQIKNSVVHYEKKGASNLLHVASDLSVNQNLAIDLPDLTGDIKAIADCVNAELKKKFYQTDYAIDFNVELPLFKTLKAIRDSAAVLLAEPIPRVAFEIKKFDTTNEFSKSQFAASFSIEEDDKKNVRSRGIVDSKSEYHEEASKTILKVLDVLKATMPQLKSEDSETLQLRSLIGEHTDAVKAIVPKLSSFGPITFNKSWTLQANKENFGAQFQLEKLALMSSLYGVSLKGNVSHQAGSIKGVSTAECISYEQLIRDAADYYNRITVVLNYLKKESTPEYKAISRELCNKMIGYLRAISDHPQLESQSLKITFGNMDGAGKIGTMTWPEFVAYSTKALSEIADELFPPTVPPQSVQVVPENAASQK